jgi:hypothetical protein
MDQQNNDKNKTLKATDSEEALNMVAMKLIDPNNELNPSRCSEKNIKSIEQLLIMDRGT